jgi:hypothetical protein
MDSIFSKNIFFVRLLFFKIYIYCGYYLSSTIIIINNSIYKIKFILFIYLFIYTPKAQLSKYIIN